MAFTLSRIQNGPIGNVFNKILCIKNDLIKPSPSHVFPSPVYPSLQVQVYVPGPVSAHVANSLQSSFRVPHIFISLIEKAEKRY